MASRVSWPAWPGRQYIPFQQNASCRTRFDALLLLQDEWLLVIDTDVTFFFLFFSIHPRIQNACNPLVALFLAVSTVAVNELARFAPDSIDRQHGRMLFSLLLLLLCWNSRHRGANTFDSFPIPHRLFGDPENYRRNFICPPNIH